jgi:hypothetical protein
MLRPTGLLLLPVAAAFWGVRGALARDWIGVALGVIGIVGTVLLVFSPSVHDTAGKLPGYTLRSGRVIYQQSAFQVEMPADVTSGGAGWLADLATSAVIPIDHARRRVAVELPMSVLLSDRAQRADRGCAPTFYTLAAVGSPTAPPVDAPPGRDRRAHAARRFARRL